MRGNAHKPPCAAGVSVLVAVADWLSRGDGLPEMLAVKSGEGNGRFVKFNKLLSYFFVILIVRLFWNIYIVPLLMNRISVIIDRDPAAVAVYESHIKRKEEAL